ncbi:MAG: hypothetical protein EON95_10900 [Caulobacteraceae bacterium]|nr:MAG: hypothetical protein EON95_10900 [Caulobacteraceae bacterium]
MTENEKRLLRPLALMCDQYLRAPDGDLDHLCISAGEEAVERLVEHGMISPHARGGRWTSAGKALLASH